jgi:hypothetical protein
MTTTNYTTVEKSSLQVQLQLSDEAGQPVLNAAITAVKVSLFNDADAAIINSRGVQDVFGVNGGSVASDLTLTAATQTFPVKVTTSADHGLEDGMSIYLDGVVGMTELNERTYIVRRVNDTQLELLDEDGTLHTAWSSGGTGQIGLFTLQLDAADNAIIGTVARGEVELHVAEFDITYSGNSKTHFSEINVLSLLKIT